MDSKNRANGRRATRRPAAAGARSPRLRIASRGDEGDDESSQRLAIGTREFIGIKAPAFTDHSEPSLFARASEDLELASIPHPLFVIGTTGQIEYVNELAEALVGYTQAELIGHTISRIISGGTASIEETSALPTRVRFLSAASGLCVHHRLGREAPVSVVLCPHRNDSVIALVTPLSPVPEQGVPESRIAEFVHDFKNPLTTIALEMRLLEDKADVSDVVGRVSRNVRFLDCMARDMLDSCAIAAGELSLRRQPTNLRMLLEHVVDRATPTCDRARVFLEGASEITISIDELRIERVVSNLLQNALKHTSHVSWIVVRLEATAGAARISVSDGGPGVTPDELRFIFDKYRRADGAAREGSGLGLYVSKQIIEAHGGRMGVSSVRNIGSRFYFELPMTSARPL